jgi:hypothetical protein
MHGEGDPVGGDSVWKKKMVRDFFLVCGGDNVREFCFFSSSF